MTDTALRRVQAAPGHARALGFDQPWTPSSPLLRAQPPPRQLGFRGLRDPTAVTHPKEKALRPDCRPPTCPALPGRASRRCKHRTDTAERSSLTCYVVEKKGAAGSWGHFGFPPCSLVMVTFRGQDSSLPGTPADSHLPLPSRPQSPSSEAPGYCVPPGRLPEPYQFQGHCEEGDALALIYKVSHGSDPRDASTTSEPPDCGQSGLTLIPTRAAVLGTCSGAAAALQGGVPSCAVALLTLLLLSSLTLCSIREAQ